MKKSMVLGFLLLSLCMNNTFGQESAKNTVYAGIGISVATFFYFFPGFTVEYERSLNNMFSVSADIGLDPEGAFYGEIKGRWYPWSKAFFAGLGARIW